MQATAVAHPNIALVKYWGKRDDAANLPATGSLSVTLGALATRTTVRFDDALAGDRLLLNGAAAARDLPRVTACLDRLRAAAGMRAAAEVSSDNDFPTGAGLASSASGFAALVTAGAAALGISARDAGLAGIARLGSGSAPRSLHGGYVVLQADGEHCEPIAAPADWPLGIVVAVTSTARKAVSSRDGMAMSRDSSPCYPAWLATHEADLAEATAAVRGRDFARLAAVAEASFWKMHAVMVTTRPALLYFNAASVACIDALRALREDGVPLFFTMDAGPQVKAFCPPADSERVAAALRAVPGVIDVISGGLGEGARVVADD